MYGRASYQKPIHSTQHQRMTSILVTAVKCVCIYEFVFTSGILDQGEGVLIVFDETPVDKTYESALETIQSMGKVVDSLYEKTKKLH